MNYQLNLKESLDFVIKDFCIQLSGKNEDVALSLNEIVEREVKIKKIEKEINFLKNQIKKPPSRRCDIGGFILISLSDICP